MVAVSARELLRLRRLSHRIKGYEAMQRSLEYALAVHFFSPDLMPHSPDPFAVHKVSKREWEKSMKEWRREMKHMVSVIMPIVLHSGALETFRVSNARNINDSIHESRRPYGVVVATFSVVEPEPEDD